MVRLNVQEPKVSSRPPAVEAGEFFSVQSDDLTPREKGRGLEEDVISNVTHEERSRGRLGLLVCELYRYLRLISFRFRRLLIFLLTLSFDVGSPLLCGLFLKGKPLQRFERTWRNR